MGLFVYLRLVLGGVEQRLVGLLTCRFNGLGILVLLGDYLMDLFLDLLFNLITSTLMPLFTSVGKLFNNRDS